MIKIPSTPERSKLLLTQWRNHMDLTKLEHTILGGEIKTFDRQLNRLINKRLRVAVFGKVGVGKSSLLNALLRKEIFATDIAHGCTRKTTAITWNQKISNLEAIELVDTPGIDEISAEARSRLAARIALQADVVLFVLDSDLTSVEIEALKILQRSCKPILFVLNRCDQWKISEQKKLIISIKSRLPLIFQETTIHVVAAAPRKAKLQRDGRVRSQVSLPMVKGLQRSLISLLQEQGELLLALNSLKQADLLHQSLKQHRLKRSKSAAQTLIGKFAAIKASGVAANPLLMLDLAGGLACDTALIVQLSKLYGLNLGGHSARQLLKSLSLHNALIGGTQVGIQVLLGIIRNLLLVATPITGGVSIASAGPIALAQAALAVHTTKIIGRLAAKEFLFGSERKKPQPREMLIRLAKTDPKLKRWVVNWQETSIKNQRLLQTLLP